MEDNDTRITSTRAILFDLGHTITKARAGMVPVLTTWANLDEAKKAPEGTIVIGEVSELLDLFEGLPQ